MGQWAGEAGNRIVRFRCRGHRNLRALHHKTLELSRDAEISERATCVVGVAADYDPRKVALLQGPVELRLEAAGLSAEVTALVSPLPAVDGSLVLRRSCVYRGQTFATGAGIGAEDLDRRLAAMLADPETALNVTLREISLPGHRRPGALLILLHSRGAGPPPEARRALLASTAVAGSGRGLGAPWGRGFDPPLERLSCRGAADRDAILAQLELGRRVSLVVEEADLGAGSPAVALIRAAAEGGSPVLPATPARPWLLALVASGLAAWPLRLLGPASAGGSPQSAESSGDTLLWWGSARQVLKSLQPFEGEDGWACLVRDPGGLQERFLRGPVEACRRDLAASVEEEEAPGSSHKARQGKPWYVILSREGVSEGPQRRRGEGLSEVDPLLRSLLGRLLEQEVPVGSLARAVAQAAGIPRRQAYQDLLELRDTEPDAEEKGKAEDPGAGGP